MKYRAENIKIPIDSLVKTNPREVIIRTLNLKENDVKNFEIIHCSLDSRFHKSSGIYHVYHVSFDYPKEIKNNKVKLSESNIARELPNFVTDTKETVAIIGSGPSGLFAALRLIEYGFAPIIFERGKNIDERVADVKAFWEDGTLNPESNIQFGLGGAGTFSDGKLRSRIKNPLTRYVGERFVEFGAASSILYDRKPHLGTDHLRKIIVNMKAFIEANGGVFHFNALVSNLIIKDGQIQAVVVNKDREIPCSKVILAIGNGARDTFEMLQKNDVSMTAKSFAVGVRMEHPQEIINQYTYGSYLGHPLLPSAEYQLTYQDKESNRSVYSFCNCPGGYVINASSEPEGLAVNGMSFSKRNAENANSALVVNVNTEDFETDSVLAGIDFQRKIERAAYRLGGSDYRVPVMSIADFIEKDVSAVTKTTIRPGYTQADISHCLPDFVTLSLRNAILRFSRQIEGFDSGILSAPETRTSSPVRIVRNAATMESVNVKGLYPVGEGAGYAGGIISSAVDGVKAVDKLMENHQR